MSQAGESWGRYFFGCPIQTPKRLKGFTAWRVQLLRRMEYALMMRTARRDWSPSTQWSKNNLKTGTGVWKGDQPNNRRPRTNIKGWGQTWMERRREWYGVTPRYYNTAAGRRQVRFGIRSQFLSAPGYAYANTVDLPSIRGTQGGPAPRRKPRSHWCMLNPLTADGPPVVYGPYDRPFFQNFKRSLRDGRDFSNLENTAKV
eukprot:TRINITY_DN67384_c2_g2_i1.p1 TRINITY_DN67384_c2_g2~~TRINITY_DN67384_c2_g2_i1.p1  ORF type:complete len:201 (+),score=3.76 TRINITY_DN67384_c2_g2_i1:36-638(+)